MGAIRKLGVAATAMTLLRRSSVMADVELLLPAHLAVVALNELGWLGVATPEEYGAVNGYGRQDFRLIQAMPSIIRADAL